jgi:restriction system protein
MTTDPAFHYPPDLFDAVVDAVPLVTRGKRDVVLFFRGCGVDRALLADIERRIDVEPNFSKYHITREILTYLNEFGDRGLAQRREVLRRLSQFDDFSSCYPDNQMKARGAVATVAQLINKKDSFTRLQEEHEQELKRHRDAKRAEIADGAPSPRRYGEMVSEDRALRLARYEVYRFGGHELARRGTATTAMLNRFFDQLLALHPAA